MWGAQFVSNIGSWMQTVAAQWLMLTLTGSATYVALVQTAAGLPVVLFAILAGTIGDLVGRRRFLLLTQSLMLLAAAALGALARPSLEDQLMTELQRARLSRRRTGATSWRAWQDADAATRILEQFVVASWDEHLRQHERVTKRDQDRLNQIRDMTDPARPVTDPPPFVRKKNQIYPERRVVLRSAYDRGRY
jgi:Transmembrane secretion effector